VTGYAETVTDSSEIQISTDTHFSAWVPLAVIDEHRRECLALDIAGSFRDNDVVGLLRYLLPARGCPGYACSDNSPEFVSEIVKKLLKKSGVKTTYIALGNPWENGYIESFNSRPRK
jgi:putative transposase